MGSHVVVVCHDNLSYHGYHLPIRALNPNTDPRILTFARERLLPAVRAAMGARHQFRTYYYGNFATAQSLNTEQLQIGAAEPGTPVWRTFDHRPRFGTNYVGLRNRIAILSEAYSYWPSRERLKATEALSGIVRFVAPTVMHCERSYRRRNEWQRRGPPRRRDASAWRVPSKLHPRRCSQYRENPRSADDDTMTERGSRRDDDYGLFRRREPPFRSRTHRLIGMAHATVAASWRAGGVSILRSPDV